MSVKMRAHHVFCSTFMHWEFPERGEEFMKAEKEMKELLRSDGEVGLEVAEGIDGLCLKCTNCVNGACVSPKGNEEGVRKWDWLILKELGVTYGETRRPAEWRALIEQKRPLAFCRTRCPYGTHCGIFR